MGYRALELKRLSLALLVAGGLHALVLLGPGPDISIQQGMSPISVDVLLMPETGRPSPAEAPERAMDTPDPEPPPLPSAVEAAEPVIEAANQEAVADDAPRPSMSEPAPAGGQTVVSSPDPGTPPATPEVVTSTAPDMPDPDPMPAPQPSGEELAGPVSTADMLDRALDMARAGLEPAGPPARVHHIDARSARSPVEASYIEAWVRKVEQVGNQNYPAAARRERVSGTLVLSVLLDQEGQVLSIELGSSSGHAVLDEAAREIVELASPFAPFPIEMRRQYDQLMITRTWAFRGGQLSSGR